MQHFGVRVIAFSFFRKSNLLIASTNSPKHLHIHDIHVYNWGLMLEVRWSKTVQYHNRTLLVPVPKIDHSKLCPHRAIVHAFKLLAAHDSSSCEMVLTLCTYPGTKLSH